MQEGVMPAVAGREGGYSYKWKVLTTVIFGVFMVILDTTVVNVAFQELRHEFGSHLSDAQWIISVYVLALGISTPLAGFLADRFGIKRTYLTGLSIFIVGSLLAGLASNLGFLVAARAIQGVGGGIALPLSIALLFSAFPVAEQGMALGIFGVAAIVAPALGPILGGYLVDQGLWRWIFFINPPIGLVGIILGSRFLRERTSDVRPPLDLWGLLTVVIGFGAILYGTANIVDLGWESPVVMGAFAIGVVGLIAFTLIELYVAKTPLLDLRLFRKRIFLNASLLGYVSVIALFGAEFLMPLYLQALRGLSALETGLILLPLAIAGGISVTIAGRLYDKIGPRMLVAVGFGILMINTWQLSQLQADSSIQWIMFLLALRGIALGLTVQTTLVTALSVVPMRELARGSSLTNASRNLVQAIGVAVLATVLASTISPEIQAAQRSFEALPRPAGVTENVGLCTAQPVALASNAGSVAPNAAGSPDTQAPDVGALLARACEENVAGFERAYTVTFFAAFVALLLGLMLPGWPKKWGGRRAADAAPIAAAH